MLDTENSQVQREKHNAHERSKRESLDSEISQITRKKHANHECSNKTSLENGDYYICLIVLEIFRN